jgi:hypothetical protein
MVDRRADFHQTALSSTVTLQRPEVASFVQSHAHSVLQLTQMVASQATVLAYGDALLAAGVFVACFSPIVTFLKQRQTT